MRKLFVIMPFGVKRQSPNGDTIDFDHIYRVLIQHAAKTAEFEPLRSDEITESGRISEQFLRELFHADTVLADVTLPNENVFYELGIRQTMGTGPAVLIARAGAELPFDFRDQRVLLYDSSSDTGIEQSRAFLAEWLKRSVTEPGTNPIQQFLRSVGATTSPGQDNEAFEQDLRGRVERARYASQLIAVWKWAEQFQRLPPLTLAVLATKLAEQREWAVAIAVIDRALETRPDDFELHRYRGFYLRNLGPGYYEAAENALSRALELNPGDPEALGMRAGLYKRQRKFKEAAEDYHRAAAISPSDTYIRVNLAAMKLLSHPDDPFIAQGIYRELLELLKTGISDDEEGWTELKFAEAYFVLGDDTEARAHFKNAARMAKSPNTLLSPADQLELFASVGFRPVEARDTAIWLRSLPVGLAPSPPAAVREEPKAPSPHKAAPLIIHLTDVHFGTRAEKDGSVSQMHRWRDGDWSQRLSVNLRNEFVSAKRHTSLEGRNAYLVVSGDFVYQGTTGEFNLARGFLEEVCADLSIPKDRVVLCPGNHDVNWDEARIDPTHRFDPYLSFLQSFYGNDLFRKLYPFVKWDFTIGSKRPEPWELLAVQSFPDDGILMLSLNSCVYETPEHHYGFIGGTQLRNAAELLDRLSGQDLVRVAVFHHHVHPYPETVVLGKDGEHWHDQSAVRDSALVERQLEKYAFDLVLHGHKHKPQLRESVVRDRMFPDSVRPLIVCGGGSCGVSAKELPPSGTNHYEVIELLKAPRVAAADFVRLAWREIALTDEAEWITSKTWTLRG